MGHLDKNYARRNAKLGDKKRCCEYCKQEGHEVENFQEKLASDCMGVRAQGETRDDRWKTVKAKHGCSHVWCLRKRHASPLMRTMCWT